MTEPSPHWSADSESGEGRSPDREITWVEASEWDDLERRRALRHLREVKRALGGFGESA